MKDGRGDECAGSDFWIPFRPWHFPPDAAREAPDQPPRRVLAPLRTDAERLLWSRLRGRRLGWKFRFQHSLGPYVADFVCLERRLIIEADGGQHNPQADRARTAYLRNRGFRILRFWNHDILRNIDGVVETTLIILNGGEDPRT